MSICKKLLTMIIISPLSGYAQFPFLEATIDDIQDAIKQQKYTCEQITQMYLDRIRASNLACKDAPPLNAFVSINENIYQQAKDLDYFYHQNKSFKGSLHCIPVVIKDNIDSYDSPTSVGSLALLGSQPPYDAQIVTQLRTAGAIILGKTAMDEFASGISGISSRTGRTGNAYQTNHNAGGSSGGSAVAVSANFAVIGIGTDNSGSVRIPGAYNGVYALRPSMGNVSQKGIFPRGNLDGTAGVMARTVHDLKLALDVIVLQKNNDLLKSNSNSLQGKTFGILTKVGNDDQFKNTPVAIKTTFYEFIEKLKRQGAVVIDDITLPEFNVDRQYNRAGEREQINAYLKKFASTRKDYQDICQSHRLLMEGGSEACLEDIVTLPSMNGPEFQKVMDMFKKNKDYVHDVMQAHHLDALITLVDARGIAYEDSSNEGINCLVASNAGLPGLAMIAGVDKGSQMPIGVELIGKQNEDYKLLAIASEIEKWQKRPLANVTEDQNDIHLDIQQYNNLITMIGYRSFEGYLTDGNKLSLTPAVFQSIVKKERGNQK